MKKSSKKIKQVRYVREKCYLSKCSKVKKLQRHSDNSLVLGLMTSVSIAGIMTAVVGGSVLLYSILNQESKRELNSTYAQTCGLSQEEIDKIKRDVDLELFDAIQGYQNQAFERIAPKQAVESAMYDVWQRFKIDYCDDASEECKIRFGHIERRGCQATQMYLSNIVGDENVFLQMLYDDINKKVVSSKVHAPQNIHAR